jgi:hypothetical protein
MGQGLVNAHAAAADLVRGDHIIDNDPRMPNRRLEILRFEAHRHDSRCVLAVCRTVGSRFPREFRIRVDRIFSDGKPRRSGFSRSPR